MKKICFLLFSSSLSFLYAQKDSTIKTPRAFITVNVGLGIPTNSIYIEAISASGYPSGSYGEIGYTVNAFAAIPITHSRFGIAGFISYNAEPFDVNKRFLELCGASEDEMDVNNQLLTNSSSDFKETLLMAGVYYSPSKKQKIDFKFLMGDNICTLAGYSFTGTSSYSYSTHAGIYTVTENIASSMPLANSSSMAFDIGIDWHFLQMSHFLGLFSADFMYSQAYFNTTYTEGINTISEHYRTNYNLLNFNLGIGYRF